MGGGGGGDIQNFIHPWFYASRPDKKDELTSHDVHYVYKDQIQVQDSPGEVCKGADNDKKSASTSNSFISKRILKMSQPILFSGIKKKIDNLSMSERAEYVEEYCNSTTINARQKQVISSGVL